jgi:hypothetical protein
MNERDAHAFNHREEVFQRAGVCDLYGAAILELSPNVVRIRAHRARLKPRKDLKPQSPARHANG